VRHKSKIKTVKMEQKTADFEASLEQEMPGCAKLGHRNPT
jgi:hypothetical protein